MSFYKIYSYQIKRKFWKTATIQANSRKEALEKCKEEYPLTNWLRAERITFGAVK